MSNFLATWVNPSHSLFFLKQYWYRLKYRSYFDSIEKFPLTVKQRQSIIVDEHRNLVIAGAGTGKTSTVVGKVGFLIKSMRAKPKEILAIAYNRDAAKELKDRIKEKTKVDVDVGTFHSIGKSILHHAGQASRPHKFVDQDHKLHDFLNQILQRCLQSDDLTDLYFEYFKKYEFKNIDEIKDFKTERQYANWLKSNRLITLNNETVKSHGELLIANFLFTNGVEYKYEDHYSSEKLTAEDKNYRPDFYLPKYHIYLEYFGIDEQGNTAEYIPKDQYREEMDWKFETHKRGNTKLIDLYFYQKRRGVLLQVLEEQLNSHEVKFFPIPKSELFKVINNTGKDTRFLKLVQQFLAHYKERQNSIDLNNLIKRSRGEDRELLFLKIFETLLNAYQAELTRDKSIDFGDMISVSAKLISQKKYYSKYKYIIIDEFQDISDGRYDLILQLLRQNKKTKLFCVGDDWQAIYRFAGSDHKIMTNFRSLFGKATILKLDQTFRYNDKIASVSGNFISRNPSQIRKKLKTLSSRSTPQIFVHWHDNSTLDAVKLSLKIIQQDYNITTESLLILSRYNDNQFTGRELKEIKDHWNGGNITQKSVHSSKGLEADFVLVSDLKADYRGFPSQIEDDPILNLVLSAEDKFEDSEERRLLYVALTRAKHQTHLISDSTCPSSFAEELANGRYAVKVTGDPNSEKKCPACVSGMLVKKNGRFGEYSECSNRPVCKFKPLQCSKCNSDVVLREDLGNGHIVAICQSKDCRSNHEQCEVGVFKIFEGIHGTFLGCHDYSRTKCKGKKSVK